MIFEPDFFPPRLKSLELADALSENFVPFLKCPLCDEDEFVGCFTHDYDFVICECEMIFQPMYMTQEQTREYYKHDYRSSVYPYKDTVTDYNTRDETRKGKKYMSFLNDVSPKKHLDIGSSTGIFLKLMKDAHGCESLGVEPGDVFREYSIKSGINTVADISEVDGKFDLISMGHVLEHLANPLEMLEVVRNLLEDSGRLFIEVPKMMPSLDHPLLFNEISLIKMIHTAGFQLMEFASKKHIRALVYKGECYGLF